MKKLCSSPEKRIAAVKRSSSWAIHSKKINRQAAKYAKKWRHSLGALGGLAVDFSHRNRE